MKTLISGLSEPLGALLAYLFLSKYISVGLINIILLLVSGLMITLAIEQIYPEITKYKNNKAIIGFILGIILVIISIIL